MDAPIIKAIAQRHAADCGVACLAMICGVPYENALVAVAQEAPNVCITGVWTDQIVRAAKLLGFSLRRRKRFDLDADTGILHIHFPKLTSDREHFVVLWEGRIIDTDGGLYLNDVYLSVNRATANMLLVAERLKEAKHA